MRLVLWWCERCRAQYWEELSLQPNDQLPFTPANFSLYCHHDVPHHWMQREILSEQTKWYPPEKEKGDPW